MRTKQNILIVDHDLRLSATMSSVLRQNGYSVTAVKDGSGAIEMFRERPFDVIFMDLKTLLNGGAETYRRIKQVRPDTEITLMLTTRPAQAPLKNIMRENIRGSLFKPLSSEKLCDLIEASGRLKAGSFIPVFDCEPELAPAL